MSKVHNKAGNAGKAGRERQEQFPMELKHISALIPSTLQITLEKKIRGDENKSLAGEKGKNRVPIGQKSPRTSSLEEMVLHCSSEFNPYA